MSNVSTRTVLKLDFVNNEGKTKTLSISNPKEGLTSEVVEAAMNVIAELSPFVKLGTDFDLTITAKGARTVETVTSDFGIAFD